MELIEKFENQSVIVKQNDNLVVHPIFILVLEREVEDRNISLKFGEGQHGKIIFEPDEVMSWRDWDCEIF